MTDGRICTRVYEWNEKNRTSSERERVKLTSAWTRASENDKCLNESEWKWQQLKSDDHRTARCLETPMKRDRWMGGTSSSIPLLDAMVTEHLSLAVGRTDAMAPLYDSRRYLLLHGSILLRYHTHHLFDSSCVSAHRRALINMLEHFAILPVTYFLYHG